MGIDGHCDERFAAVRAALEHNLSDPLERGESVAIVIDGHAVVDLWGGFRDQARQHPWQQNTLACMFSVGKPIAALVLGELIESGEVALDDEVARYWPQYARAGKGATTIDHVISHLAGLPGLPDAARGSAYDWDLTIQAIEQHAPLWEPGSTGCYHTFTYGHLVGEIVRRVTGQTVGERVNARVAQRLELELGFGLDTEQQSRCADVAMTPGDPLLSNIMGDDTLIGRCWTPLPLGPDEEDFNTEQCRSAQMPSFNGHATARALAVLYSTLGNALGDDGRKSPFSRELVSMMTAERWSGTDALGMNNKMARGFRLANSYSPFNGNERAFGHSGIGGALAFGDPDRGLGFGFLTNRLAPGPGASPYAMRLVSAVTDSLTAL